MTTSPEELRAKLEAGRRATADELRQTADEIEKLPLDTAAEALVWLQDCLPALQREADLIFREL